MGKRLIISGADFSAVAIGGDTILTVATPIIVPSSGTVPLSVSISCSTSGATIYYTTDGTTPTTSSNVYSGAFTVNNASTIKAIAVKAGMNNSSVASATYTTESEQLSNLTISHSVVDNDHVFTMQCDDSAATIYYTTDGSDPTTESSVYNGAVAAVRGGNPIKAIAVKNGNTIASNVFSYRYYNETDCSRQNVGVRASGDNIGYASNFTNWWSSELLTTNEFNKISVAYTKSANTFGVLFFDSNDEPVANSGIVYELNQSPKSASIDSGSTQVAFCYMATNPPVSAKIFLYNE